jgi:hypothetical protein
MYSISSLCPSFKEELEDMELVTRFVDGLNKHTTSGED